MPMYLARASARQVEANRRNSTRSTGPRTDEGKSKASQNSTRHGLCARVVHGANPAMPGESRKEYLTFAQAMRDDLKPSGQVETVLVDRAAQLAWKLRRVPVAECDAARRLIARAEVRHERAMQKLPPRKREAFDEPGAGELIAADFLREKVVRNWNDGSDDPECDHGVFERLQIYEQRIERQFHGCLQQLRLLRKMKRENGDGGEEGGPRIPTNRHESNSGAQICGTGGPPVSDAPARPARAGDMEVPVARASRPCSGHASGAGNTGGPPVPRNADTGWKPELRETRAPDALDFHSPATASAVRDDSCGFVDEPLPGRSENAVERTKPNNAEIRAGKGVADAG